MSHVKYSTLAFVVSTTAFGEADKTVRLYTRDFGMIFALAKSVRLLKSKLKGALEQGNLLLVSLVKGKDIWRLTDASVEKKIDIRHPELVFFLKTIKLLRSLVQGEEKNEELFVIINETFEHLSERVFIGEELESLECLTALRMLETLGYGRHKDSLGISIFEPVSQPLLQSVFQNKRTIVNLINKSIQDSHL